MKNKKIVAIIGGGKANSVASGYARHIFPIAPEANGKALPRRVKLIDLPDSAQAVVHIRDTTHLEMTVYGYTSKGESGQLIAPFSFESEESRDAAFANDLKLADFAKAIFMTQMAVIDPELNTDNFKTENNGN